MKPISLKISGINSFATQQEINFEELSKYSLFGIFGDTGSGKTTIVDCIILALYNKVPRFGNTNKNNIINTECKEGKIEFEFKIVKGAEENHYLIRRNYKIKKDASGVDVFEVKKSLLKNETTDEIIADKTTEVKKEIEKIVGLNYDDFTKAVILPQGKFSTFLNMNGNEKTTMLERIFKLEEYGKNLKKKISDRHSKLNEGVKICDAQINTLGVTDEVDIETLEKNLIENKKSVKTNKGVIEKLLKEINELNNIIKISSEYNEVKKQYDDLEEEKFVANQIKYEKGVKVSNVKYTYDKLVKSEEELINITNIKEQTEDAKKRLDEQLNKQKEENELFISDKQSKMIKIELELSKFNSVLNDIKKLKEIDSLTKELEHKSKSQEDDIKTFEDRLKEKEHILEDINNKIKQLQSKKESEYTEEERELLEQGNYIQIECESLKKEFDVYTKEIGAIKDEIAILNSRLEDSIKNLSDIELDKLRTGLENIEKIEVCSPSTILGYRSKISKLEAEFKELKEKLEQLNNERKELEGINSEIEKINTNKISLNKQLININDELAIQNKVYDENKLADIINTLRENILNGDSCKVCGGTHINDNIKKIQVDEDVEEKLKNLEIQKEKITNEIQKTDVEYKHLVNQKEEKVNKIKEIEQITADEDLNKLEEKILKNNKYCDEQEKLFNEVEYKKESIRKRIEIEDKKYNELIREKEKLNIEIKSKEDSVLKQEKLKQENVSLQEEKSNKLDSILSSLKINGDIKEIYKKAKEIERNNKTIDQEINRLKEVESEETKELNELKSKLETTKIEVLNLKKELATYDKEVETLNNNVKEVLKGEDETTFKETREEEQKNLQLEEQKLITKLEEIQNKVNDKNNELSKLNGKLQTEEKNKNSLKKDFEKLLVDNNIQNFEEEKVFMLNEIELQSLKEYIDAYVDNKKKLKNEIIRLEEQGAIFNFESKIILKEDLEEEKNKLEEKNSELVINIGKNEKELESIKNVLVKIKELKKEKLTLEKELDVILELRELLRDNGFVKFLANRELQYITMEASNRLLKMTGGKFALEVLEDEFIIKDNLKGGTRRKANTLSGGENFMTSLSLALALSKKVQLRNDGVLEFFFLDEGFGTLDSKTLHSVANTLVELQKENLNIGIISHVDELKELVPRKIITKMTDEGTKIIEDYKSI